MTQNEETQGVQFDQQVSGLTDNEYTETIVSGEDVVELYVQSWTTFGISSASVQMTPRQARQVARALLEAADVAEDNAK